LRWYTVAANKDKSTTTRFVHGAARRSWKRYFIYIDISPLLSEYSSIERMFPGCSAPPLTAEYSSRGLHHIPVTPDLPHILAYARCACPSKKKLDSKIDCSVWFPLFEELVIRVKRKVPCRLNALAMSIYFSLGGLIILSEHKNMPFHSC
jgi:hypothetical protein